MIGVNYGTDDLTVRFAASVSRLAGSQSCSLVIVDNTENRAGDDLERRLRAANGGGEYVRAPENLGYFGGAEFGLNTYLESHILPEWVLVSNVDVEFRDTGFLEILYSTPIRDDVAALAPAIMSNATSSDLNPHLHRKPLKAMMRFRKVVFSNFYTLNLYEMGSAGKNALTTLLRRFVPSIGDSGAESGLQNRWSPRPIYAPHGSCIVFSGRYFERGGDLNYPPFLFGEEFFVAETVRRLDMQVMYDPRLRLWHDDHASTGFVRSRRIAAYVGAATRYVTEHYFS
jgi:GT2 family glycosyltransferase